MWWLGILNIVFAAIFLAIPLLYRFGELIAPLTFFVFAYLSVGFICYTIGTGSGLQFYFLVSASLVVLVLGIERIVLASTIVAFGVAATIALELFVPNDRGLGPSLDAHRRLRQLGDLLGNHGGRDGLVCDARNRPRREGDGGRVPNDPNRCWPTSCPRRIANRLKDPSRNIIADKYDDASILFADIAGYTKRASDTTPSELVRFLDRSTPIWTPSSTGTGWRRSRPVATRTWWSAACRNHAPTTSRRSPASPSTWPMRSPT